MVRLTYSSSLSLQEYTEVDIMGSVKAVKKKSGKKRVGLAMAAVGYAPKYPIIIVPGNLSSHLHDPIYYHICILFLATGERNYTVTNHLQLYSASPACLHCHDSKTSFHARPRATDSGHFACRSGLVCARSLVHGTRCATLFLLLSSSEWMSDLFKKLLLAIPQGRSLFSFASCSFTPPGM